MGVLWSGLMDHYGAVIGLPFAIEGFAFFIEAIFLGIYLYGWDRLPPRVHLLSGVPIVVAGHRVGVLRGVGERLDERAARVRRPARPGDRRGPVGGDVQPGHRARRRRT